MQTRPLLLRSCKLGCLFLDKFFRTLSPVKFSSVNTEDPTKLIDIVLPVQLYFSHVINSIESATTDPSISEFRETEFTFGRGALGETHKPWSGLNNVGKAEILSKLDPGDKYQCKANRRGVSSSFDVQQPASTLEYQKKNVRPTRLLSNSKLGHFAKNQRQSGPGCK